MSNSNESYAPRVKVGPVYQRKSASGATYFAGRLGTAKLVIVKAKEPAEDGMPVCARVVGFEVGANTGRLLPAVRARTSRGSRLA